MKKGKIYPGTMFFAFCLLEILLRIFVPILSFSHILRFIPGLLLVIIGVVLNLWTDRIFKNERTTIKPFDKSSKLVDYAPFTFSRNPIYLGLFLILIGLGVLLGDVLPIIFSMIFPIIIQKIYIDKEERQLEQTFGKRYLAYKKKVRMWI